jgi:hypothetical protein
MKIICIDNSENNTRLTIGKIYETLPLLTNESNFYRIIDDNNRRYGFYKERFSTIKEIRKEKLKKLNNVKFLENKE